MNAEPLVSIIVPVYGTEAYLPNCIDSIARQTYRNIEIILVDDQSPDACPEICDAYAQKDARVVVIHQKNKGVSGARNAGIRRASGAYIMFVDSDDELYPDAVKILLEDCLEHDADIVSGKNSIVDKAGSISNHTGDGKCIVYRGEEPIARLLEGNSGWNNGWAKIFRKSFIDGIFFSEGRSINEDGYFLFECFLRQPVLVQRNVPLYQINYREGSGSRQRFSDRHLAMLYFCEQKKKRISELYPQYMNKFYNLEIRTNLFFLDCLCGTSERKYRNIQKACVRRVRELYRYHIPINRHQKQLARIVRYGLYPLYKAAVRFKYYR